MKENQEISSLPSETLKRNLKQIQIDTLTEVVQKQIKLDTNNHKLNPEVNEQVTASVERNLAEITFKDPQTPKTKEQELKEIEEIEEQHIRDLDLLQKQREEKLNNLPEEANEVGEFSSMGEGEKQLLKEFESEQRQVQEEKYLLIEENDNVKLMQQYESQKNQTDQWGQELQDNNVIDLEAEEYNQQPKLAQINETQVGTQGNEANKRSNNQILNNWEQDETEGNKDNEWEGENWTFGGINQNSNEREERKKGCFKCGQEGHMARDCPNQNEQHKEQRQKGVCFKCGESGHMARECPNQSQNLNKASGPMKCFNCGEEGHMSKDCSKPKKERKTITCFNCGEEGHMSKECPHEIQNKKTMKCFNCGEEGHMSKDCLQPKKERLARDKIICFNCGEEGHMSKECPQPRKERPPRDGQRKCFNCGEEGHVSKDCQQPRQQRQYQNRDENQRGGNISWGVTEGNSWENKNNENEDQIVDNEQTLNWADNQTGQNNRSNGQNHNSKKGCFTCGEEGHISRDCPNNQGKKNCCFKCGKEGHIAKDCPEQQNAMRSQTCRNCGFNEIINQIIIGQEGHFAKDCPEPKKLRTITCRNCGIDGHIAKDCPQPRKLICHNCGKEGHFARDCQEPRKPQPKQKFCIRCGTVGHFPRDCMNAKKEKNQNVEKEEGELEMEDEEGQIIESTWKQDVWV